MGHLYNVDLPVAVGRNLQVILQSAYQHTLITHASLIGKDGIESVPVDDIKGTKSINIIINDSFVDKILKLTSTILPGSQNPNTAVLYDTFVDDQLIRRSEKFGKLADGKDDGMAIYRFF